MRAGRSTLCARDANRWGELPAAGCHEAERAPACAPTREDCMALELEKAAGGLIRRVQKALGRGSAGASFAALLYGRKGIDGLESLPADWLAEQRARGARVHRRQAEGSTQDSRSPQVAARKGLPETAVLEILNDDMPFLVDFDPGRAAGARTGGHPAAAPHLQDPARQDRPPAADRRARRGRLERWPPGKLHRHPPAGAVRRRQRRPRRRRSPPSSTRCAWWSRTGSRCCNGCRAATRAARDSPATGVPRDLLRSRSPS